LERRSPTRQVSMRLPPCRVGDRRSAIFVCFVCFVVSNHLHFHFLVGRGS
jgi:hypothetical protein